MDFIEDFLQFMTLVCKNKAITPLTTQSDNAFGIGRNKECQHRQQILGI